MTAPRQDTRRWVGRGALLVLWVFVLTAAPLGSAHISVVPAEAETGIETPFVVRIPNETGATMTAARITFPSGIRVAGAIAAPAGWIVNPVGDSPGDLAGADYDGSLASGEQLEVTVVGTPTAPGPAVWRVAQTLADGRQVLWTGNPDPSAIDEPGEGEVGPAAAVIVSGASLDAPAAAAEQGDPPEDATASAPEAESSTTAWIAVIAAAIALLAVGGAGWMWSNRPMDLPDDEG